MKELSYSIEMRWATARFKEADTWIVLKRPPYSRFYHDYLRKWVSLKRSKCRGSNLRNHKACNDPCIWLLPTSVLCEVWLDFVLLLRTSTKGNCSDVPSGLLDRKGPGTLLRYTVENFYSHLSTDLKKVSVQTCKTQHSVFLMVVILFVTWWCLTLYLETQPESIRMDDVVVPTVFSCLLSPLSLPHSVCLLCHLLSLCVVVFSLPPLFTCLLLPLTCTPATSSVVSNHTARQSRVSSR